MSSSGLVTPVGNGTCTITCKSKADSNKYATCSVTIKPALTISPSSASIAVGGTKTVTASVVPSGASVTGNWSTGNTGIANVSSTSTVTLSGGSSISTTVTGTGAGSTDITFYSSQ